MSVICRKCICDADKKIIECTRRALNKTFSVGSWTVLNQTTIDYEILQLDVNQLDKIDVQFPFLRFPLKVIDLSHNKIKQFAKNVFSNLKYLEEINLSYNELTTELLKSEIFEGRYSPDEDEPLMSLKRLRLSNNLLHNLDDELFVHTKYLQELYLDNNPFQIIHANVLKAFSDLLQLQLLDMSRMELSSLPEDIFHPLKELKVLKLDKNLFKTIPGALQYAINVKELSLNENPIGDLNEQNSMPVMAKLEKLSMVWMKSMTSIGNSSMARLENLTEVRLSHNHNLSFIHPSAFSYLDGNRSVWPPVKRIFLDNCNLTTLDNRVFINWRKMEEVHIQDNPW